MANLDIEDALIQFEIKTTEGTSCTMVVGEIKNPELFRCSLCGGKPIFTRQRQALPSPTWTRIERFCFPCIRSLLKAHYTDPQNKDVYTLFNAVPWP